MSSTSASSPLSEVEQTAPDSVSYHDMLKALFRDDERFRQTVCGFAEIYLGRGEKGESGGALSEKEMIAVAYLLEEVAHFACLVKDGISVFRCPGAIKTFEDIVEGQHPGVPEELKRVVLVAVRLKRGACAAARAELLAGGFVASCARVPGGKGTTSAHVLRHAQDEGMMPSRRDSV